MRTSIKVALLLILINFDTMTALGMLVVGLAGPIVDMWCSPSSDDLDFAITGVAGLLWPLGIPLVMHGLDRWKDRCRAPLFLAVVVASLYLWAVLVVWITLLLLEQPS
jgi:hypothetical protein